MGTANFRSMRDFPLIVAEDRFIKACPVCGGSIAADHDTCDCGADISCVGQVYDESGMEDVYNEMSAIADELNDAQMFYKVSVESGYYSGLQFYVEDKYVMDDMTNDDTQYEFGLCRSVAMRKYKTAFNAVRRGLKKAQKDLGLIELGLLGRFSNGEAIYNVVG